MLLITQSGTYAKTFLFYFGEMTMLNGLIAFCLLCSGSFLGTLRTSKSFKLLTFWLLNLVFGSRGWMKQKDIFFLWKQIIILPPVAPIKQVPLSMSHPIISRSCLLIFLATFSLAAPLPTMRSMAEDLLTILLPPTHRPMRTLGATLGQKVSPQWPLLQLVAPP
jgi:hypothetical protein